MRARFYRGPMNGKVRECRDDTTILRCSNMPHNVAMYGTQFHPSAPVGMKITTYRRTNHTHPDGSVFFEWDEKKGKRLR